MTSWVPDLPSLINLETGKSFDIQYWSWKVRQNLSLQNTALNIWFLNKLFWTFEFKVLETFYYSHILLVFCLLSTNLFLKIVINFAVCSTLFSWRLQGPKMLKYIFCKKNWRLKFYFHKIWTTLKGEELLNYQRLLLWWISFQERAYWVFASWMSLQAEKAKCNRGKSKTFKL